MRLDADRQQLKKKEQQVRQEEHSYLSEVNFLVIKKMLFVPDMFALKFIFDHMEGHLYKSNEAEVSPI